MTRLLSGKQAGKKRHKPINNPNANKGGNISSRARIERILVITRQTGSKAKSDAGIQLQYLLHKQIQPLFDRKYLFVKRPA